MKIHKSQGFGVPQARFVSWSSRITWPCWTSWKARHQGQTPWCQATGVGRAHCWIDMSVGLHPPYLLILLQETSICYAFYLRLTGAAWKYGTPFLPLILHISLKWQYFGAYHDILRQGVFSFHWLSSQVPCSATRCATSASMAALPWSSAASAAGRSKYITGMFRYV